MSIYREVKYNFFIFSIEGSIGSGKSTVIDGLKKIANDIVVCYKEEVNKWEQEGWLKLYYTTPKRSTLAFQCRVHQSFFDIYRRMRNKLKAGVTKQIVVERSSYSAQKIFTKHALRAGLIDVDEYNFLKNISKQKQGVHPHIFIYIKTNVDKCLERIKKRGRQDEQKIDIGYLEDIDRLHNEVFTESRGDVRIVDGNQPAEKVLFDVWNIINKELTTLFPKFYE